MNLRLFFLLWFLLCPMAFAKDEMNDEEFRQKLSSMLEREEKSIRVLREQITESQSAPFLPDLYLQLADLLSEKANTLYYIQMEKQKGDVTPLFKDHEISPVITAQKEAIRAYRLILKDFSSFDKKKLVQYRLALALKSIDEISEFMKAAGELIRAFPHSKEAMGTHLLLGQYYFEKRDWKAALDELKPVTSTPNAYERNLAKYRIGLVNIAQERFREALTQFEEVIRDPELKAQDNPYDISLKEKRVKTDLKREALIDSIRAYTHVFERNPEPVSYYSKLAPTEIHFQEVIEKLAMRYITLKKYDSAIKLLRTVSERTADPQKIITIYRDVLAMIPIRDRTGIPVEEIRFLLEKYNLWSSYFQIPPSVLDQTFSFFEKQVRELGTTSHALAKTESQPEKKREYLRRAGDFYQLYLGYFHGTSHSAKMATNLADVYFAERDYLPSGEYYLRTFLGEFGPTADKKALIQNALLCLQKKEDRSFYDRIRMRGLLIRTIESYLAFNKTLQSDPAIHFLLVKSKYEQGFFPGAFDELLAFAGKFPKTRQAVDAGELILDYFNTRNDYAGLESWSAKLLGLRLPHPAFAMKLQNISKQAKSKLIHERARTVAGFDEFSQGKSYLTIALTSEDATFQNMALKEALAKSRMERDIRTFLKAAELMAAREPNAEKRGGILRSIATEQIKMTQYYRGLKSLEQTFKDSELPSKTRVSSLDQAIRTALVLRDWQAIREYSRHPLWKNIAVQTKNQIRDRLVGLLESAVRIPPDLLPLIPGLGWTDDVLLVLYKAQFRIDSGLRGRVLAKVNELCRDPNRAPVCRWHALEMLDVKQAEFTDTIKSATPSLQDVESQAPRFATLMNAYRVLEGSGDSHLEILVALRNKENYLTFGQFLERGAKKNPELKPVLLQKAKETFETANSYTQQCRAIAERSPSVHQLGMLCPSTRSPTKEEILKVEAVKLRDVPREDPDSDRIEEIQRELFASQGGSGWLLDLAKQYLDEKYYRHASATAVYGMATFKDQQNDFRAILGCGLVVLGYTTEAAYHLKNASDYSGLKEKCLSQMR